MTELTRENATVLPNCSPVPAAAEPARQPEQRTDAGIRVVMVDDDDAYREAVAAELSEQSFAVRDFGSGAALFDFFADGGSADLIVLDWRLPGTTGLDLLGQIRRRGIMVPVIFLTGMPATSYENAALDNGALDFVNKSRGAAILAKRIRLIMRAGKLPPEDQREEMIVVGNLVLRPKVSRAMWKDEDVNLTVVEFNIVLLLVQQAGEYTTYRAIYDCVHHAGFIAGDGENGYRTNVRSSIKRIRNKFRAIDPGFAEIENFLAFGYRWRGAVHLQPN